MSIESTARSPERRYTADDLLGMENAVCYELVDGQLVWRGTGDLGSWVGMNVGRIVGNFVRDGRLGFLTGSAAGLAIFANSGDVRRASVVFTSRERMGGKLPADGHATVPPELVVEVHSRHDRVRDIDTKVEAYFAAGVLLIWLVNPDTRVVRVLRPDGFDRTLRADAVIDVGDVLSGFSCPIASFFDEG